MSAPELNLFSLASIGIALLASLTGSLHCVGMCGPLRLFAGSSAWAGAKYQAGRLAAYILLGLAAGSIGAFLPTWAVLLFLVIGIALSLGNFRFPAPVERLRARAIMAATAKPWLIGFISGALPCGLLHGWLAAAAATGNAIQGAALLFMLWLGTVPALEASTHFLRRPVERLRRSFPRALPIALLLLAFIPIAMRMGWSQGIAGGNHCSRCHETSH